MTRETAMQTAANRSTKSPRYVVWDGDDFGASNVGQGGYQVANESDLEGFYNGCTIIACFENGEYQP